jgi:hypothetical protein
MRQTIEVALSCEDALALVIASFEGAKTAPTRAWDYRAGGDSLSLLSCEDCLIDSVEFWMRAT